MQRERCVVANAQAFVTLRRNRDLVGRDEVPVDARRGARRSVLETSGKISSIEKN